MELAWQYAQLCLKQKFYPGGVCWLQARDENIESQLVKFAKTQLHLELSEDLNLQEQINYCWSHWLQGDALVILDNVRDYQQVEPYLPPSGSRFKVIVTTKELYQQSWLDASFELLSLDALKQEHEDGKDEFDGESYPSILLGTALCLQLISSISLISSYIWCNSSPWQQNFHPNGWIIEFIRSGILFFELGVIYFIFKKEAFEFFGLVPSNYRKSLRLVRRFIIVIAIASITSLVYYHFNFAPNELAKFWDQVSKNEVPTLESKQGFKLYTLPYIYYFPYSFINFILIGGTVISVSLYSATKDLIELLRYKRLLNRKLSEISLLVISGSSQVFFRNKLCQRIEWDFEEFCRNFIDKIGRYTFLFLVFALGVSFEVLIGRITLATTALFWLSVGYLLFASTIGVIFLGYLHYENALKESAKFLFNLHCENLSIFEERYNTLKFFQRILRNYVSLYLGIILIIVAPLLAILIEILIKVLNK